MSTSTALTCALSGSVPAVPVVARTSGLLFERRLIEQQLQISGNVCPITKQPLTPADLLPVLSQANGAAAPASSAGVLVRPRPPAATSIPGLLSLLQGEWDGCMLETFHLKQQCEKLKQDLAHALYKEDASARVIARLIKERDAARQALLQTEQNVGRAAAAAQAQAGGVAAMDIDDSKKGASAAAASGELPEFAQQLISNTSAALSKTRKANVKEAAAAAATAADLQSFKVQDKSHPLHATTNPGILCVDISRANGDLLATGGNDGKALVFQRSTGKIAAHLNGHKSAVNAVQFHPSKDNVLFTASADHSACAWASDTGAAGKWNVVHHFGGAKDALTGLSVHASGDLLATASKDGSWSLYDAVQGAELRRTALASESLSTVAFHPDGALLAAGSARDGGVIRVYDVKTCTVAAELKGAHIGGLTALAFSDNGFHAASAEASGAIKLWDLRKLANIHTIQCAALEGDKAGALVSSLSFDGSASFLAAAVGSRVAVYAAKSWEEIIQLAEHKDRVTGVAWGSQARSIASVSMDRNLKIWA